MVFATLPHMSGRPRYSRPPAAPINDWVRQALAHAGLSQSQLTREMHKAGIIKNDRSIVQKMTVNRKVSAEEAAAISRITGYPLPNTDLRPQDDGDELIAIMQRLGPEERSFLLGAARLLLRLPAQAPAPAQEEPDDTRD